MGSKVSKVLIVSIVIVGLLLVSFAAFFFGYRYVRSQDESMARMEILAEERGGNLANEDTPNAISIIIPRSSDVEDIAKILKKNNLISNTLVFQIISKFNGFNGRYQAGTHYLLPGMSYDEIMYTLTKQPKPVKITFVEGETYQEMLEKMLDSGLKIDIDRFNNLVQRPNEFLDYEFVRSIPNDARREWGLQGYMWPDTYWFDPNIDEVSIIRMFLDNTQRKLEEGGYREKAAALGMTLDEVMTMASVVQKEGNIEEMSKIGRVFLNRYQTGMPMESCATINYLRLKENLDPIPWALDSDLKKYSTNPYNTYAFPGLPPGPINNPGTLAIEGVLWPANEDSWQGAGQYLYFCATGEGDNVFSTTFEEHQANIDHYSAAWYAEEGLPEN